MAASCPFNSAFIIAKRILKFNRKEGIRKAGVFFRFMLFILLFSPRMSKAHEKSARPIPEASAMIVAALLTLSPISFCLCNQVCK